MTIAWLFYVLIVGTLVMAAASAIARAAHRVGRPTRFIWATAMMVLVAFGVSARLSTPTQVQSLDKVAFIEGHLIGATAPASTMMSRLSALRSELTAAERKTTAMILRSMPSGTQKMLIAAWITASTAVFALILLVNAVMIRQRARWPLADLYGSRIRLTHDVGPAVIGITSPEIVVPSWLLGRTEEEQRLALTHEREHLSARDHLLLAGGWLVVAAMPWHPATWMMLSRMRLAIELDCDKRVLRRGVTARSYGKMLIDVADHCSGQRAFALALADHTSHLERRLIAMKSPRARFGRTRATILAATGGLALLIACESSMPTSAEIERSDVAALEKKAVAFKMISDGVKTAYLVDGQKVTAEKANALTSDQIATVNIVKDKVGNEIRITTRKGGDAALEKTVSDESIVTRRAHDKSDAVMLKGQPLSEKTFDGIFVIDGKRSSPSEFYKLKLDAERIQSVEVFKGEAAMRLYSDDAARNGVIKITTKP